MARVSISGEDCIGDNLRRAGALRAPASARNLARGQADFGTSEIRVILSGVGNAFSSWAVAAGRLLLQQSATMRQAPKRRHTFRYLPRSSEVAPLSFTTETE